MSTRATGTLKIKTWEEKPFKKLAGGARLTRASVTQSLVGDLKGAGTTEYLIAYRNGKSARFFGIHHIKGRIGDRSGSFALQVVGTFEGGIAKGSWLVIPGLGTGGLHKLRGKGAFKAPIGSEAFYTLNYDFGADHQAVTPKDHYDHQERNDRSSHPEASRRTMESLWLRRPSGARD